MSLLETHDLLRLHTELLRSRHQELYQLTLTVVTITRTAMSVIYLRDGNLKPRKAQWAWDFSQETQLQVWVTETQPQPCLDCVPMSPLLGSFSSHHRLTQRHTRSRQTQPKRCLRGQGAPSLYGLCKPNLKGIHVSWNLLPFLSPPHTSRLKAKECILREKNNNQSLSI